MRIIFFGSDDFARAHLDALGTSNHQVAACVTQPDKPQGRGLKVVLSPIKEYALEKKIPCLQPENFKDKNILEQLKAFKADLFVVIAYGKILPAEVLEAPALGAINVHGSLLPKYRGAAPINWAVINGEQTTGLTIIKMNSRMDAGDILAKLEIAVEREDTAVTLRAKMAKRGPGFLLETIDALAQNKIRPVIQKDKDVTFAPKLFKDLGKIDWKKRALEIHNLVRGLLPWPAAYTIFQGKMLKVLETEIVDPVKTGAAIGEITEVNSKGLVVACGQGAVLVKKVHLESAKAIDGRSFAAGYKVKEGFKFENS